MFKLLKQSVPRLTACCGRYSTCWCPDEPFDPSCQINHLPNGMRIVTEENQSPLTCISLFAQVGPRYEPRELNGITHFIEHLVYKGFSSMNKSQFETMIRDMGARLTVNTWKDMQSFSVTIPSTEAEKLIKILSLIIFETSFCENELDKETYNIYLERYDTDRDPKKVMFDYLHTTAFQGTALAQPVIGPSQNIANFNASIAACFMCDNYTSNRLLLAISGDVKHKEMVAQAACTFGYLNEVCYLPDIGPRRYTGAQLVYRDDSMPLMHLAIAFEAPGFNSPDYLKMLVMSCIIGSWHKSQGRSSLQPFYTAQAVGSYDICESYESFYIAYQEVGLWGVYFVTEKYRVDEVIMSIQEAWMNMTFTHYTGQFERGINLAKLKIAKRFDGVVNSAFDIGTQMMYTGTRWSYSSYLNQLNRLNVKSIKEAGERYLSDRLPVVAAVGPSEGMPPYVRIHSGMYWLRR